jgi:hypothetical protein
MGAAASVSRGGCSLRCRNLKERRIVMQTRYTAPVVVAVFDAAVAVKGIDKSIDSEVLDPNAQMSSAAYKDEE